jgi:hypothetical protein
MTISEIAASEYNPYYKTYIDKVGDATLLEALHEGLQATKVFFSDIPIDKLEFRYAEGKWTPKEILLHIIDSERVFAYRALTFARSENSDLPGFDEGEFSKNSMANRRSMEQLINEFSTVRHATISLYSHFSNETLQRIGKANGSAMSVRAAGFVICGHEKHHIEVVKERYLK